MALLVRVWIHSAPACRPNQGSSRSKARFSFHTAGCLTLGARKSTLACGVELPRPVVGCSAGSAWNRPSVAGQAPSVPLPQPTVRSTTPVLEYGLLSHTDAASPWNRPTPPRSWPLRRSAGSSAQLKPMRGCHRLAPSSVLVLSMPKPPVWRVPVPSPVTVPATTGAAAAALASGVSLLLLWSRRRPSVTASCLLTVQVSCRNRPVLVSDQLAAASSTLRPVAAVA